MRARLAKKILKQWHIANCPGCGKDHRSGAQKRKHNRDSRKHLVSQAISRLERKRFLWLRSTLKPESVVACADRAVGNVVSWVGRDPIVAIQTWAGVAKKRYTIGDVLPIERVPPHLYDPPYTGRMVEDSMEVFSFSHAPNKPTRSELAN